MIGYFLPPALKLTHELREIYRRTGAEETRTDLFPGAHEISGRYSYDWLFERLSGPDL